VAFGVRTYDPPLPVRPAARRFFKRCARRRQRMEDRRLAGDTAGDEDG
jgi:hypothetical protein